MFKFTIRELLLVTVIVSVVAAWWIDHRLAQRDIQRMGEANARLKYEATVAKEEAVLLHGMLGRRSGTDRLPSNDPFR